MKASIEETLQGISRRNLSGRFGAAEAAGNCDEFAYEYNVVVAARFYNKDIVAREREEKTNL